MAQLVCKNLKLGYENKIVKDNVNFVVEKGNYLSIVGENGAGKSTLMKAILGLNPQLDGEIIFGDGLQKNQIGYLPQQTQVQRDFPASVWEIVLSGYLNKAGIRPYFNKSEKQGAKEKMERLHISDLAKRCYRELSGGQQQRVLLARALCATEKMLLLDEPVSGLDPKATEEMYAIIKELNENGITIIMISHDLRSAIEYSTHILKMNEPFFFGTKQEYISNFEENGGLKK